ncbi:MAG: SRPBCC family protein [Planctomycetes bacterium]|jgi:ligand-binding SRPBCC domain-containing protein|nr:SRPBCC family protein [Planctomycetota bacterium]
MPHYTATLEVSASVADLFSFFSKPKNLVQLAPPELNLELVSAPAVITTGARLVWKGRRWGISQQIIQEVAAFDLEKLIALEQKQGPFARWLHSHHFEATGSGAKIVEAIDFEPPGGMLGMIVTAAAIQKDLDKLLAHRQKKLNEIFG